MVPRTTSKIEPHHLDRKVYIYIRQSTEAQVQVNTASTARQYDLVSHALELGWRKGQLVIVDEDQARSATTTYRRGGYKDMISDIALGHVGAVICLNTDRLSRDASDWHYLLKICEIAGTLIIDQTSVRDPSDRNDRLFLGIDGVLNEAEIFKIRDRLIGGKLRKAKEGALRLLLPAGYIYDHDGRVILDPDERVQQTVKSVFKLFERHGSAGKVVRHFTNNKVRFPKRPRGQGSKALEWVPLRRSKVLKILHNPAYAGAYVYGRYRRCKYIHDGEVRYRIKELKRDQWGVVKLDIHQGYISWEEYLLNVQKLSDNLFTVGEGRRGAVRAGGALLQGIIMCGKCGGRMRVQYQSKRNARYTCASSCRDFGVGECQSVVNSVVDAAVANEFLQAVTPTHLEISVEDFSLREVQHGETGRQWALRLKQSRSEEQLSRQRFMKVDPENDLVFCRLQREWNEKIAEVKRIELEAESIAAKSPRPLSALDRQAVLALAQDVPKLWHADQVKNDLRKQLLRFLIKEVTIIKGESTLHVGIQWQTDAYTATEVSLPTRATLLRTDQKAIDRIRELATNHSDQQIAEVLNKEGVRSKYSKVYTIANINRLRKKYGIPTSCPDNRTYFVDQQRGDGRYTSTYVAQKIGVHPVTISLWCRQGRLDAIRHNPPGPWWIKVTPRQIIRLRKMKGQRRAN